MKTKDLVLEKLKEHGSVYVSGQQIADELYLSRAAVWKAIKTLEKDGYKIEAVTNKGYRLWEDTSLPDRHAIKKLLKNVPEGLEITVLADVDSTNNYAKAYYAENPKKQAVIIAACQSGGRGRRGRSFFSPGRTGMYMTFLLHPDTDIQKATKLTCLTAVAFCRAIKETLDKDVQIKWVNDLYFKGRKISGILTEGETSIEDGSLSYIIIGAGLNLYMPQGGFPEELKNKAGALLDGVFDADLRNRMYASVINHFFELYNELFDTGEDTFLPDYKEKSMLLGKKVKILGFSEKEQKHGRDYALVTGIDDECRLLVRYEDGSADALSSGEVSVVRY